MDFQKLVEAMGELDEDRVKEILQEVMDAGGAEAQKAMDACQEGMNIVGKNFEEGEYFVGDLIYAGELMSDAVEILKEALINEDNSGPKTKMILCTVKDDLHDIGKNIVKVLLENYSFDVIDLGKDVPPETILEAVQEQDVKLVGLSALMTTTVVSMEETIKLLRKEAPDCKVMVGGAVLNQDYADMIGADFYGKDAMQSVYYAQKLLQKK